MDQIKIGKFIAKCRKNQKLTQAELAEKLNISDRAVSKWETGKSMPDSGVMLTLCDILKISVNELLNGEVVQMENYNKVAEQNLLEMVKQKEQRDKQLLSLEYVIGYMASTTFLILLFVSSYIQMESWLRILLIVIGFIQFMIGMFFGIKIEQIAGYYECNKCHHKFVPTYKQTFFAPHINRTRRMKCPECSEKSWCKKVISKD